jgi:hypothetical protein
MQGINTGILTNAHPLSAEQIKALERRVAEEHEAFAYLDENSQLCFALPYGVNGIKDLAWHNAYEVTAKNNTLTKKVFSKTNFSYEKRVTLMEQAGSADWDVVVLDGSITKVHNMTFIGQQSIKLVIIPDSVRSIGSSAFCDCTNLTEVVIGAGVSTIGSDAFTACHSLERVYYHGTESQWQRFVKIEEPSGGYITNATRYYYSENRPTTEGNFWHFVDGLPADWADYVPPVYSDGMFYISNDDDTCTLSNYGECTDTIVLVPPTVEGYGTVTSIANQAFYNCLNITSITIPEEVTSIGMLAFADCKNLATIIYTGTVAQWNAVNKGMDWKYSVPATYVRCSNGQAVI